MTSFDRAGNPAFKQGLSRREWLAVMGLTTLTGCSRNKGTGYYGYALVANGGDNSLAAVDLTAFRLISTVGLNGTPSAVLAAPDQSPRHQAYVLTPETGSIHVIDAHLERTNTRKLADSLSHILISGDGHSLLAFSAVSKQLIQTDLGLSGQPRRHRLAIEPKEADVSSSGHVAVADGGAVELLHLESGKRAQTALGSVGEIRFRADGKVLLAANLERRSLMALAVPSLQMMAELPLAMTPQHLCFNADQGQLFIAGPGMDGVAIVFPYNVMEVDQTVLAGRMPGVMACSETPAYLFVGSESGSDVCILNIDSRKVVGFVGMGGRPPSFIAITPDNQYALVLDRDSGTMGVIHVPAIRANRLKTGVALFTMIGVGSKPVHAAVIPRLA